MASKDFSDLEIEGREFKPHLGDDFKATARFEANTSMDPYGITMH